MDATPPWLCEMCKMCKMCKMCNMYKIKLIVDQFEGVAEMLAEWKAAKSLEGRWIKLQNNPS